MSGIVIPHRAEHMLGCIVGVGEVGQRFCVRPRGSATCLCTALATRWRDPWRPSIKLWFVKLRRRPVAVLVLVAVVLAAVMALAAVSAGANSTIDATETLVPRDVAPGRIVNVDGYAMHVRLVGDPLRDPTGAPLVLIHGFASSSDEFRKIEAALAVSRSLILPDLLGFGYSQRVTKPVAAYSHRGQAALMKGLLDQLGVGAVDVLGSSYGGAIAAQFVLDDPGRVRRIVFVDGQLYDTGSGGPPGWVMALLPFRLGRVVTWSLLAGGPGQAALLGSACVDPAACAEGMDPVWRVQATRVRGTTDALLAFSSAPRDVYAVSDLSRISIPALAIWGEQDKLVPLDRGQRLASALPNARLEVIAGVGHVPHLERPAAVIPLLLAFLGR